MTTPIIFLAALLLTLLIIQWTISRFRVWECTVTKGRFHLYVKSVRKTLIELRLFWGRLTVWLLGENPVAMCSVENNVNHHQQSVQPVGGNGRFSPARHRLWVHCTVCGFDNPSGACYCCNCGTAFRGKRASSPEPPSSHNPWHDLTPGKTKQEVRQILGDHYYEDASSHDNHVWYYEFDSVGQPDKTHGWVKFELPNGLGPLGSWRSAPGLEAWLESLPNPKNVRHA